MMIATATAARLSKVARPARALRFASTSVSHTPNKDDVHQKHWEEHWSKDQILDESSKHAMATWGPGSMIRGAPVVDRYEGVYIYDKDGKQYLDWTSQAVCTNLGGTMPESVKKAWMDQASKLSYVYGGLGMTESRIRLASLLAKLMPGDITGFLFPTSGAEANEAAIRMARRFTGKSKIINFYRSYHGGTTSSLQATGDFRRNFCEGSGTDGATGFVKTMNPTADYYFDFASTDEERVAKSLGFLEEQIRCEGAHTVAAIMLESVGGSVGVYPLPTGYVQGVRALCDKYDILLILDEVMVGFGRTGKMWGFQHYDVIPDIVTSAKGLTGSFMPCSMVACRQPIMDFFETNPLGWGSTFQAHPLNTAVAYACVKHMLETDLVGHVSKTLAPIMKAGVEDLAAKFKSVGASRAIGCFGCIDLLDPRTGAPIQDFSGRDCSNPQAIDNLKSTLRSEGVIGFTRPPVFHCAPPLVISPEELKDGFARVERAIEAYDKSF